jgi:3'(2'), 5'-bisphosphate nucleotidase
MHPFIDVARPLAQAVARRLMELRLTPLHKERKADHSIVTNADREADLLIRMGLRAAFPDHTILTEESTMDGSPSAEFVWVVDPLDGTRAYVKGVLGFSVMIGVLRHGKPYAGVVVDPMEGHVYEAVEGLGCFYTLKDHRERVRVSARREWAQMPVITSTGFPETKAQAVRAVLPGPWVPAVNSVGIKVGFTVRGLADLYINHHGVHYWDTCAPQIILEEAGGMISFYDGSPLRYDLSGAFQHPGPTLASNGTRHAEALALLKPIMQSAD